MKIYKYKELIDPKKHSHFYQIVLQNIIWCAKPDDLNDKDELKNEVNYEPTSTTASLLASVTKKYGNSNVSSSHFIESLILSGNKFEKISSQIVGDLIRKCRQNVGIVSFSFLKNDNHMWEEYGGNGNGVCIEIDIPNSLLGELYWPVQYVNKKSFHIDIFLESALFPEKAFQTYRNILLTKTKAWEREKEIRFVGHRSDVNLKLDGPVTEVTLGHQISSDTLRQVEEKIGDFCMANNIKVPKLR